MDVADHSTLRVRQVGCEGVGGIQARGGSVRVPSIVRDENVACEVQKAQVTPNTGMELLSMEQKHIGRGSLIQSTREVRDIRDALLLIYNQVVDDTQILRCGLRHQVFRGVAISSTIIHMHMKVATYPAPVRLGGELQAPQAHRDDGALLRVYLRPDTFNVVFEPLHHLDFGTTRGKYNVRTPRRVKIMRLKGALRPVETVIGMNPRIVRDVSAPIGSGHGDSCRRGPAHGIEYDDPQPPHRL